MEAAFPVDQPYAPVPERAAMVENIRPGVPDPELSVWFARRGERVVGYAKVEPLSGANAAIVGVMVRVYPAFRRRGVGTALLRAISPRLGDGGRTNVTGGADAGGPGEAWATALGFAVTAGYRKQRLDMADADRALWNVAPVPGFALRSWSTAVPEELLAAYAAARNAIHDRPRTETYDAPHWTPAAVRDDERDQREHGVDRRVVAAVDESTGEVAGLTIMEFMPGRRELGQQRDTAVLARYRGRGLGLWLKAAMLTNLARERADMTAVVTSTSLDNVHMARISAALGFREPATTLVLEQSVEDVAARLWA
ncbi:MAG TPA: GNAT family N-acetyltransferase [Phytomonospora sp.]